MSKPAKAASATNTAAHARVPALRFPEFRNAPGWEKKFLGQAVESVTTGKLDANAMVENGKYRFYTCAKNYYFIDDYAFDTEALLVAGNGAYLGYIHYYKGKFNAYQRTYVLSGFKAHVTYLKFFLDKNLPERIRAEKKDGNTPYIVMSTLTDMPIMLPQKAEQQKIADCLSSLDELIAAQASKVEALKAHKKGLMQQLFPAEGQTIPALRFPEFRNAGEWREDTLANIINTVTPPEKLQTSEYNSSGRFPIIDQSPNEQAGWTDNELALISAPLPLIVFGDHTCNLKIARRPFVQGADGIKIFYGKPCALTDYLFQHLQYDPVKMEEYKRHFSILKEKKIRFPDVKTGEQQKIADCLSSLDELIAAQTSKVEALKAHKKGLMQQLFPTIHEDAA